MIDLWVGVLIIASVAALVGATLIAKLFGDLSFPLPSAERRIGCVDGLRGYLALAVMIHHFAIWIRVTRLDGQWAPPEPDFIAQLGAGGVALFFMVTGLVFYPYIARGVSASAWPGFYVSRVFRIIPLVLLSIFVVCLVIISRTGGGPDDGFPIALAKWISGFSEPPLMGYAESSTINAKVLWSLFYEWIFYLLILPVSVLFASLVRRIGGPSWITPAAVLVSGLAARTLDLPGDYLPLLPVFLPAFAIGMIAYEVQAHSRAAKLLRGRVAGVIAVVGLIFGLVGFASPFFLALPLFGLFFICTACGNSFGGVLETRGARVLGECSFGIYLLHGIVLSVLFNELSGFHKGLSLDISVVLLPAAIVAIVLLTPLTFLLVERPAIRLGHQLRRKLTSRFAKRPASIGEPVRAVAISK